MEKKVKVTGTKASAEKKAALAAAFGETDQIYVLTYDDIYALDAAHMSMTRTYASVKVFDADKKAHKHGKFKTYIFIGIVIIGILLLAVSEEL